MLTTVQVPTHGVTLRHCFITYMNHSRQNGPTIIGLNRIHIQQGVHPVIFAKMGKSNLEFILTDVWLYTQSGDDRSKVGLVWCYIDWREEVGLNSVRRMATTSRTSFLPGPQALPL